MKNNLVENNSLITLTNIKKIYGTTIKTEALSGVSFNINQGEFLSIIGPSGSGKSTILNIIGTLDKPSQGSYLFLGEDVGKMSQNTLATFRNNRIGFVFQFHHLLPEFTALENVLMPYNLARKPIDKSATKKAEELLSTVGVLERKNNKATNLSGGQQQRVAIARALMNEPSLILADEPTGNLDSESTEQVYSLMRDINKRLNTTFIIVTHDIFMAAKSDRIIEIFDGKIKRDMDIKNNNDMSIWDDVIPANCSLKCDD